MPTTQPKFSRTQSAGKSTKEGIWVLIAGFVVSLMPQVPGFEDPDSKIWLIAAIAGILKLGRNVVSEFLGINLKNIFSFFRGTAPVWILMAFMIPFLSSCKSLTELSEIAVEVTISTPVILKTTNTEGIVTETVGVLKKRKFLGQPYEISPDVVIIKISGELAAGINWETLLNAAYTWDSTGGTITFAGQSDFDSSEQAKALIASQEIWAGMFESVIPAFVPAIEGLVNAWGAMGLTEAKKPERQNMFDVITSLLRDNQIPAPEGDEGGDE